MRADVFKIINAVLSVAVFAVLALLAREYIVWKYRPLAQEERASARDASVTVEANTDFSRLKPIGSGLFGKVEITFVEQAESIAKEGASVTDIALLGTVVGRSGLSYAIFQSAQTKKQEISRLGEKVFNIGVLTGIEKSRVTINSNGRLLTLYLPQEKPPLSGKYPPAQPPVSSSDRLSQITQKTGESEWVIDQRALDSVLNNMEKVLTDARLLPYSDNGKISGFRVSEIKPDGVFNLIGLKNGDILLRVNDLTIDSPEKGVQLLTGLRGESSISLNIIRNGQPKKLNYQIR